MESEERNCLISWKSQRTEESDGNDRKKYENGNNWHRERVLTSLSFMARNQIKNLSEVCKNTHSKESSIYGENNVEIVCTIFLEFCKYKKSLPSNLH